MSPITLAIAPMLNPYDVSRRLRPTPNKDAAQTFSLLSKGLGLGFGAVVSRGTAFQSPLHHVPQIHVAALFPTLGCQAKGPNPKAQSES